MAWTRSLSGPMGTPTMMHASFTMLMLWARAKVMVDSDRGVVAVAVRGLLWKLMILLLWP
jgi:hypothetical protein